MGKISKMLLCIILIIISIFTSCTPSKVNNHVNTDSNKITDNNEKAIEGISDKLDNNAITEDKISNKFDYSSIPQNFKFNKHGPIDEKNSKFNPSTGDVLYIASNIYPPFNQEKDNPYDYDFLGEGIGKVEYKYDETEKFLYLRNIYTQEMFLVDKVEPNNEQNYTFKFTEDNQIEINGKVVSKDIKTLENLVYVECNSDKSKYALKIDQEVANKVSAYIKENYNIDSKAMLTLTYNNVCYVVVKIPDNFINYNNSYKKISTLESYSSSVYKDKNFTLELWKYEDGKCKKQ